VLRPQLGAKTLQVVAPLWGPKTDIDCIISPKWRRPFIRLKFFNKIFGGQTQKPNLKTTL